MPKENNVQLTAISRITQDNQNETIETVANGSITEMPGASYLRYVEETSVDDTTLQTNVAIKLGHDDTLQIRRTGAANAQLTFDLTQPTTTHYRTAAGNLLFDIHTHELEIDRVQGTVHVKYTIKTGEDTLGQYDFTLNYTNV